MSEETPVETPKPTYSIFLAAPNAGRIWPHAARATVLCTKRGHRIHYEPNQFGDVPHNFNMLWCMALRLRPNGFNRFAMIHSDLGVDMGWLDTLLDELDETGADIISAVMAIKDPRRLTTTGIRYPGVWGTRRLTVTETDRLPETFGIRDTDEPDQILAMGTGLWVARLDRPWAEAFPGFQNRHRIDWSSGQPEAWFDSEDWLFSDWASSVGLDVRCTRKVLVEHVGEIAYQNRNGTGGWETERQRPARPLTVKLDFPSITVETEHPIAVDSLDHTQPLGAANDNSVNYSFNRKLFELIPAKNVRLLDLGCAGGGLVRSILEAGGFAVGLDGSDYSFKRKRAEWGVIPDYLFCCDVTEAFTIWNCMPEPIKFNVVTGWEFWEHIDTDDIREVLENLGSHVTQDAIFIGSISKQVEPHHRTAQPKDWWIHRLNLEAYANQVRSFLPHPSFVHAPDLEEHFGYNLVRGSNDPNAVSFSIAFRWQFQDKSLAVSP